MTGKSYSRPKKNFNRIFSLREGTRVAENLEGDPRTALAGKRTHFAKLRTSLALDRTTLAWIRTAVTFATFGFGMIGFLRDHRAGDTQRASDTFASGGNSRGTCAGGYRAGGDVSGGILPLDDTTQIAPRRATLHNTMAFEHCHRCTYCGSRPLRALVCLRSMRLSRFVEEFGRHAVRVTP
jgi:hypothetical protein